MLIYPVTFSSDGASASFPDIPEALACARDDEHAWRDALLDAFALYRHERRAFPLPAPVAEGPAAVALPALTAVKILLWNEMVARKLRNADLAVRLSVHTPQIERLFDPAQVTKFELIEQAALVLGKRVSLALM